TAEVLGVPVQGSTTTQVGTASPSCAAQGVGWQDGDRISHADRLVEVIGQHPEAEPCFPPSPGYNAGGAQAGYLIELPATSTRPETVVAGLAGSLTNQHITDDANAAAG